MESKNLFDKAKTRVKKIEKFKLLSFVVAVLVPTLFLGWMAMHQPISFDGSMNLQVAKNLAEHGKYARDYYLESNFVPAGEKIGGVRLFPQEVQTNGPYIFVAALGIRVFGANQFGYQFANLFFVALASGAIWWLLRRWRIVAAAAPILVFLFLPQAFTGANGYAIDGYGEIPALSFVVLSFAFVFNAMSAKAEKKILRYVSLALICAGLAINTKTYIIGYLPALLLGLLLLAIIKRISIWKVIVRLPWAALVPVLFEIYRFVSLKSIHAYVNWWKIQLHGILGQAGVTPEFQTQSESKIREVGHQLKTFIQVAHFDWVTIVLAVLVVIAAALLIGLFIKRIRGSDKKITDFRTSFSVVLAMLVAMPATYFVWWVLLMPSSKDFTRRTYPIMLPFIVLFIGLLCSLAFYIRSFWSAHKQQSPRLLANFSVLGSAILSVAIIAILLAVGWTIPRNISSALQKSASLESYQQAAAFMKDAPKNIVFYGQDYWGSPQESLMSGRNLVDIAYVSTCSVNPSNSLLVWDQTAAAIKSPTPPSPLFTYKLYKTVGVASFYWIKPVQNC